MALNIKDPETEKLAAEVAAMAGESRPARSDSRPFWVPGAGGLAVDTRRGSRKAPDARGRRSDPRLRTHWSMILDTSAIVAIFTKEPGFVVEDLREVVERAHPRERDWRGEQAE